MQVLEEIMEVIDNRVHFYDNADEPMMYVKTVKDIIRKHMNDGWIPAEKELPEEHTCIDEETGYYGRSDDVLCSAYDDYTGEYETWIDYTIDGQWQTHEWYEGEPLAWQPLPRPYSPERSDNHDGE